MTPDPPDCAHCDAAATLEPMYTEMGVTFYTCSCCGRTTRVDYAGRVQKSLPAIDVNGNQMYE